MNRTYNWPNMVAYILDEFHFSQRELAEKCNVTQQSIGNYSYTNK